MNDKVDIHPLIDNLNIEVETKKYFTQLELNELIDDKIELSSDSLDIDEASQNWWKFKVDLDHCNVNDIKILFAAILESRKSYIKNHLTDVNLIFYAWYDYQSGDFNFSIIPKNWSKLEVDQELPFGCSINKVEEVDLIIAKFVDDPYKGVIPMEDLEDVDPEDTEELQGEDDYTLDVWVHYL